MKRSLFVCGALLLSPVVSFAIVDSNENGVSDLWEQEFNNGQLFSGSFDPQADLDGDGWTNVQEAAAGTDPLNANPPDGIIRPDIVLIPAVMGEENGQPVIITPDVVKVSWPTLVGKHYTLLASADLSQGSWIEVPGSKLIGDGDIHETNAESSTGDKWFWRVAVCDVDSDGDGLTDAEEHLLETNPGDSDSDHDGLSDSLEVALGSDPNNIHSDGDNIPDGEDAVPTDTAIWWPKTPVPRYALIETGIPSGFSQSAALPIDVNRNGEILVKYDSGNSRGVWKLWSAATGQSQDLTPPLYGFFDPLGGDSIDASCIAEDGSHHASLICRPFTDQISIFLPPGVVNQPPTAEDWILHFSGSRDPSPPQISYHVNTVDSWSLSTKFDTTTQESSWKSRHLVSGNWVDAQSGSFTYPESPLTVSPQGDVLFPNRIERPGSSDLSVTGSPFEDTCRLGTVLVPDPTDTEPDHTRPVSVVISNSGTPAMWIETPNGQSLEAATHATLPIMSRIAENGVGLGSGGVWLNGKNHAIDGNLVSAPDWSEIQASALSTNGLIAATAKRESSGEREIVLLVPVEVKQRIPDIADNGGATTYDYATASAVPWDQPTPGVEITHKVITGDHVDLTAEIYDALSDVSESALELKPDVWVNSREVEPDPGDKHGVFRLQNYSYKLYPGRNEITVSVRNALGVAAHHTVVIVGGGAQGYAIAEEPAKVPLLPTFPVVYEVTGLGLGANQQITLQLAGKSMETGREENGGVVDADNFRSKPFLAVNEPESTTSEQIGAIPEDALVFLSGLSEDVHAELELSSGAEPMAWTSFQSGLELMSPKRVEILETGEHDLALEIRARGLGEFPSITASLTTYQNDELRQDVSNSIAAAYLTAYARLPESSKEDPFEFTTDELKLKEGYNLLEFDFTDRQRTSHRGNCLSFRFPAPTKAGVRVFSANRKTDTVLEGVTGRMGDTWYPVDANASMSDLADALGASGCHVVGMADVSGCFDDAPLKRSFLVRGPPGHAFQALDQFYAAQGRAQRSRTFATSGTHGATLATELDRVQTDEELPASAQNALGMEIAATYQFHNGFEDLVPKTHQAYVDPGDGIPQPNSWTMRGSSLPDHAQSNPSPWTVTSTLSEPTRAASVSGIVKVDTSAENTSYYATTSSTAPWNLTGARAVSLRFKLLSHDPTNGPDGAFQLAAGDGTRTWTCQVAPTYVRIQGVVVTLPLTKFPSGLIDGKYHTLQFNLSGTGNDAIVNIDGQILSSNATALNGTLNGIAFGDPGAGLAGKFEIEALQFENSDLKYQYGIHDADTYADSDEINGANNILLYLRSKGQEFRTSAVAHWVRILDPNVYEWLLETYTGQSNVGLEKELHILTNKDVWFGPTVGLSESEEYASRWPWAKKTKVTNTLVLDTEETKVLSTDQTRNDMQLAGILMAWVNEQHEYRVWLAEKEGGDTGIDGILIEKKHLIENIAKCAKRVETTLEVGGEMAISITNEYADYAITIKDISQGEYMAMVGFVPFLPSSTARVFKIIAKEGGETLEIMHQLTKRLDNFPLAGTWEDSAGILHPIEFDKIMANADDAEAVARARKLTTEEVINSKGVKGMQLLDTFANANVMIFKTVEPIKAYRVYGSAKPGAIKSNYFMFEKPVSKTQVEVDYALGYFDKVDGVNKPFQDYDRVVEVEIPEGVYVHMGYAAKQSDRYRGGATQFWIEDDVINSAFDWTQLDQQAELLPQY